MKKKIVAILLCGTMFLGITGCGKNGGNIENVKIKEISSEIYSQKDIKSAINTITKEFNDTWNGCTLKEIYYAGDKMSLDYQDWADRNNKEVVIVLLSKFDVDSSGGDSSLNPYSTYDDWKWILVRNKGESWIHVDHGY